MARLPRPSNPDGVQEPWLQRAVALAIENVRAGGGPFGAVIVRDGEVVAEGVNTVTLANDPTAHAEVNAIRDAAKHLGTFDLSGCEVYASCEPCPMCFGAIYWARIAAVWFAADRHDAARAGFSDEHIYRALNTGPLDGRVPIERRTIGNYLDPFRAWAGKADKIRY